MLLALLTGILDTRIKPSQTPLYPGAPSRPKQSAPSFPATWPELRLVPYKRNLFFTGREDHLDRLYQQFTDTSTLAIAQTQAISGLVLQSHLAKSTRCEMASQAQSPPTVQSWQ